MLQFREALIKSAAVDGERFFVKTRFEKRGNTVCISRFSNRRIGGKDPSSAVGDLFRGSLRYDGMYRALHACKFEMRSQSVHFGSENRQAKRSAVSAEESGMRGRLRPPALRSGAKRCP